MSKVAMSSPGSHVPSVISVMSDARARSVSGRATVSRSAFTVHRETLRDVLEWDIRNWSIALRFWRQHSSLDFSKCSALEVGSRGGGLSLWLALQGARVVCSDISAPAATAVRKHERYGVSHLVTYERIDALDIPYANHFDVVVFKSVLGAVASYDRQLRAISEMHKALKPGGELLFAENLAGSWVHQFLRRRLVRWGRTWRYVTATELTALMAPFSRVRCQTSGVLGAFGRSERQRATLGAVDDLLFNAITPARFRYIAVGVATK